MDLDNQYGMKNQHLALLKMLDEFLLLCTQNDITFSMGFGSMLGAIRHHGFIPWDDDIDVLIDRENYEKLSSIMSGSSYFDLLYKTKSTLWIPRIKRKEQGYDEHGYEPTIDLFLVDNMPDCQVMASIKQKLVLFIQGMIKDQVDLRKGSFPLKVASVVSWLFGRLFPLSFKFWLLEKVSMVSNNKETRFCSTYNVEYIYVGRRYDRDLLRELDWVDFEDREVPVSRCYDSYLKVLYGDYMTPPKVSERTAKHSKSESSYE